MAKAQYDRSEVLERTIELFWKNGFSASSMQQVVKATGLKPGSIYLAFDNKEGLFREALENYAQKGQQKIRETLNNAPSVGEGICSLLEEYIQQSTQEHYCSCFLIKTQLELAAEKNDLYKLASDKLGEVEAIYAEYLSQDFDSDLAKKRAASLMLNIFGMRVYGYQQGSAMSMRNGLREGLPWLPWQKDM